jgi:arginyl-tRNA synthetase
VLKRELENLVARAIAALAREQELAIPAGFAPAIERSRDRQHGDFASNAALVLGKFARRPPRALAEQIIARLPAAPAVERIQIAGPGFINFHLKPAAYQNLVPEILAAGGTYGNSDLGRGHPVLIEFVSANPTGPLHIGHGRGAAYGATLANLLRAAGFRIETEYYINDAGRQMDILAISLWLRYLELGGVTLEFPDNAYRGAYIRAIAQELRRECGDRLIRPFAPEDISHIADPEARLDALIAHVREILGEQDYQTVLDFGVQAILEDIRADLREFGVEFDRWFSERSVISAGQVQRCIERLRANGHLFEQEGALWFRATAFGDEKDRVIVRDNGQFTYFASDIAYHLHKLERGYRQLINIWGADHHGYAPRLKAAMTALGAPPDMLEILLVQFATLYRGGERLQMSTRAGEFVTLRELREEVGRDAARFFYVMRRSDQHLDFDLELAKSESSDNPVYYIQYAHARICSVMRQLKERGLRHDPASVAGAAFRLVEAEEQNLLLTLSRYPEVLEAAARNLEPHQVAYYLRELANDFHVYYNTHQFLVADETLRSARLGLALATRQVLRNGLGLLGVGAPETM